MWFSLNYYTENGISYSRDKALILELHDLYQKKNHQHSLMFQKCIEGVRGKKPESREASISSNPRNY